MLQAYALNTFLKNNGFEAEQISYIRSYSKPSFIHRLLGLTPAKVISRTFELVYPVDKYFTKRRKKFLDFQDNFISHTDRVYTSQDICDVVTKGDTFIVGSDQVWNPAWTEKAFFLNFAPNNKKIAYAASFGVAHLSQEYMYQIKSFLDSFDYISVRESAGGELLQKIVKQPVHVVLDPTMLLDEHAWSEIASDELVTKEPYAFIYLLGNKKDQRMRALEIANKLNLKTVYIPHVHFRFNISDINYADYSPSDVGPRDFLGLIKNASVVITDSFHGCVFSILFKRKFWLLKRQNDKDLTSMHSRLETLLGSLNLENRIYDVNRNDTELKESINYEAINSNLMNLKEKSTEFLKTALKIDSDLS